MAIGDYKKTAWNAGGAPGISAQRLQNIEDKIEEVDKDYASHLADGVKHIDTNERTAWNNVKDRFAPICSTITDANNVTENGLYMGSTVANAPDSNWYMFEVIKHNDNWVYQKAIGFTQGVNVIYERVKQNGVWQPWFSLFKYANDGKTAVANAVTAKGVSASPSDTFSTLATKIGQINTGKKFASGKTTIDHTILSISGLSFKPSYVIVYFSGGSPIWGFYAEFSSMGFMDINRTYGGYNGALANITSDGFTTVDGLYGIYTCYWIAFE